MDYEIATQRKEVKVKAKAKEVTKEYLSTEYRRTS